MTEDSPHTHLNKKPQLVFYWILMAALGVMFIDGLTHPELTKLFPIFTFGLSMVFMVPLGFKLHLAGKPSKDLYDLERETPPETEGFVSRSAEHYLTWLVGMLAISAVFGFEIGVGLFIYAFVRVKADLSHFKSLICGLAFVAFLGLLANYLTLEYPKGFIQNYIFDCGLDSLWRS